MCMQTCDRERFQNSLFETLAYVSNIKRAIYKSQIIATNKLSTAHLKL